MAKLLKVFFKGKRDILLFLEVKTSDFITEKAAFSNSELLKKKREEIEKKKQPENSNKLEELRKKYQKNPDEIPNKTPELISQDLSQISVKNRLNELKQKYQNSIQEVPLVKPEVFVTKPPVNRLEELKKKYQKNDQITVGVPNRLSVPLKMGKSVSTTHVSCENKQVKKIEKP